MSQISDFRYVIDNIRLKFVAIQAERPQREAWNNDAMEPEWVLFERKSLLEWVNEYRFMLGKEPVSMKPILQAETWSSGHCDYTSKFSVHCAEIVFDCVRPPV